MILYRVDAIGMWNDGRSIHLPPFYIDAEEERTLIDDEGGTLKNMLQAEAMATAILTAMFIDDPDVLGPEGFAGWGIAVSRVGHVRQGIEYRLMPAAEWN